jgi:hypothetical protein
VVLAKNLGRPECCVHTWEEHRQRETEIGGDALRMASLDPCVAEGVVSNKKTTDVATDGGRVQTKGGGAGDIVVWNALDGLLLFRDVHINVHLFLHKECIVGVIVNVHLLSTKASWMMEGLVIIIIECSCDSMILLFSKTGLRCGGSGRC